MINQNKILFAALILILSLEGCTGVPRFTSDEKKTDGNYVRGKEQAENRVKEKEEKNKPTKLPKDSEALESEIGVASFYGSKFHGRQTANGETYNMHDLTAAHTTYPFNTMVRVTNLMNNKSVLLRINDRKPELHGRIIDISYAAAEELDMLIKGITKVKVEVISWGEEN